MRRYLIAALLAAAALAPAAAVTAEDAPAKPSSVKACFYSDNISGWRQGPDDKTVYLSAGARDIYELTLFSNCPDLHSAERIGVRTRSGGSFVCDGLDLDLVTPSPIGSQICPVTRMRKLTPAEIAALPKKYQP